jgi:hypothetical protein
MALEWIKRGWLRIFLKRDQMTARWVENDLQELKVDGCETNVIEKEVKIMREL